MKTTGRKFKCIGKKESSVINWARSFTIGNTYKCRTYDEKDNTYFMHSDEPDASPYWVDASQFELVDQC